MFSFSVCRSFCRSVCLCVCKWIIWRLNWTNSFVADSVELGLCVGSVRKVVHNEVRLTDKLYDIQMETTKITTPPPRYKKKFDTMATKMFSFNSKFAFWLFRVFLLNSFILIQRNESESFSFIHFNQLRLKYMNILYFFFFLSSNFYFFSFSFNYHRHQHHHHLSMWWWYIFGSWTLNLKLCCILLFLWESQFEFWKHGWLKLVKCITKWVEFTFPCIGVGLLIENPLVLQKSLSKSYTPTTSQLKDEGKLCWDKVFF